MLLGLSACGSLPRPFEGNPGATAQRLALPPPPRLAVPQPTAAFLAAGPGSGFATDLAAALADEDVPAFADQPQRGDWRIIFSAQPRDGRIVPIYTVEDPTGVAKGTVEGQPVDPQAWVTGAAPTLRQAVADAAPRVAALLTRIEAARRQSDPNSLINRPVRVAFAGVTGAPGDGNVSLARQVRAEMSKIGEPLQDGTADADFLLEGHVATAPEPGGQQRVEIQWVVKDARGSERGKVVQLNEIPAGTLDHYWGDVAAVVAQEAAGGVRDVILNQTGAKR